MSTILAVDDNPHVRSWPRGLLDAESYQVAEARDGNEGLACFHRTHLDLVVRDIYMPERDGLVDCNVRIGSISQPVYSLKAKFLNIYGTNGLTVTGH